MNKRPLTGGAILFTVGICAADLGTVYAFAAAGIVLLVILFLFYSGLRRAGADPPPRSSLFFFLIFPAFLMAGALLYVHADANSRWYESLNLDDASVRVTGTVYAVSSDDDSQSIYLKGAVLVCGTDTYRTNRILIRTYADDSGASVSGGFVFSADEIHIGNEVCAEGTVSYFSEARNPGNFNAREYYRIKGIDFRIDPVSVSVTDDSVDPYADFLCRLKVRFHAVFETCLSETYCGVLSTVVLGDDSDLDEEIEELFQEAGISHILAISGLHVSIVGMLLYRFLRRRGIRYIFCALPAAAAVLSFCVMSGMGVSACRAMIMFFVMLGADFSGRAYDALSALSLACIILLIINPLQLFSASFRLSFGAVAGICLAQPVLQEFLHISNAAASTFLLSLSIQLFTIPLILYDYYELPVYSLLTNFLLLPFVSIILICGILGAAAGLISTAAAGVILWPAARLLDVFLYVCRLVRTLPCHELICGRPSLPQIVLYYVMLGCALLVLRRVSSGSRHKERRPVMRYGAFAVFCGLLMAVITIRMPVTLRITMLDVGQGDGILIESSGVNAFIDGGSSDVTDVGTWRIAPFLKYNGIAAIDLWFVSHTDSDHTSGLLNLLSAGYDIDTLVFCEGVYEDEDLSELIEEAEENGTQVLFLQQGAQISYADVTWTMLYPEDENTVTDKNEASMVLLLQSGDFTALFTGDLTQEAEEEMLSEGYLTKYLSKDDRVNGIDLLKVAHHGSKYASTEAFLEAIRPNAAIISAGVDNMYGHPSEETISRLEEYTQEIHVTAQEGAVTLTLGDDREMEWECFLESLD